MPQNNFGDSKKRLKEMMGILRKHQISHGLNPQKLRLIFEDLGPTYIKFGQIMSMRTDMLPAEYCSELSRLRTDVRPMSSQEVRETLKREYGKEPEEIFANFQWSPIGAASIAQVHRARLITGEPIVVKVKRPGIYRKMEQDVFLLRKVSGLLKIITKTGDAIDFNLVIQEMWKSAQLEMDFLHEAQQAEHFRRCNDGLAYIAVPRIFREYTTSKVLVMEDMDGIPIDDVDRLKQQGYNPAEIGTKLAENYIKQIADDGFFHADPHPGNLLIHEGKIVWLDMGMMGMLSPRDRHLLNDAMRAVACGNVNDVKDALLSIVKHTGPVDHARLYSDIDDLLNKYGMFHVGNLKMPELCDDILALVKRHCLSLPPEFSMLGRGLVTIEGVIGRLSPSISLFEVIGRHLSGQLLKDLDVSGDLKKNLYALYGSGRHMLSIPAQISEFLKMGIKGRTKVNVELTNAEQPIHTVEKLINRLILAILDAGLFVASAILGASNLPKCFLGIPTLSAAGFLVSVTLGCWIFWVMFKHRR
ncbi:MAG: ABC transporter [Oscillospiraceae bacterium]|jgi:ubiquinone biosynthesis protein